MKNFADDLIDAIRRAGNPCVVGLDPRIDLMPEFIKSPGTDARAAICGFHEMVLDAITGLVPVVKPQLAFYEQYGLRGMEAYQWTVAAARERGFLVIADAKRNDISSTAEAYAKTFLGEGDFEADSLTVTPYLGRDSLTPFADLCAKLRKGLFVVLKTSNPGSRDFQDRILQETGRPMYERVAEMVDDLGRAQVGESGYSSIGAVIGATFPEEARVLRSLLPKAFILVPGYGAQGANGQSAAAAFQADGLGAVVSSSRGITYDFGSPAVSRAAFQKIVRERTQRMIDDVTESVAVVCGR